MKSGRLAVKPCAAPELSQVYRSTSALLPTIFITGKADAFSFSYAVQVKTL